MTLDTGHPLVSVNDGPPDDADEVLREEAQKKFNCSSEMVGDPNGSEHVVRSPTEIDFAFYWGDQCDGQLFVKATGQTKLDGESTYFEIHEMVEISESDFVENYTGE